MSIVRRVAIVTGAAQGIGKAIALRLARDGLNVVLNDLPSGEEGLRDVLTSISTTSTAKGLVVSGDMSVEKDVQGLVDTCVSHFGGVDVMVANAGICKTGPIVSVSTEDWDKIHALNVRGAFLAYRCAAIQMIKQGRGGRIIGASSVAGKQGFPEWGTYSASKFAVKGLTQSVAQELRKHNITVNAYAPGIIQTSICTEREDYREQDYERPRGKEMLPPEDVAGLVSYLASDDAKFITG
ncbi:short chain oxidoreductase [Hysterangium stoloniferum]|nr:short chain oxidoreductase [Hysterangium stoloniferum]